MNNVYEYRHNFTPTIDQIGGKMGLYTQLNANDPQWFTSHLNQSLDSQSPMVGQMSRGSLFVISNDKIQRDLLQERAKIWGVEVILANSIVQGLMQLENAVHLGSKIQLGLVEHHIPDMNGIEFIRACRQRKEIPFFPVILLTATLVSMSTREIMQLGIFEQLLLPFSIDRLHDTVSHVIPVNENKISYSEPTKSIIPIMDEKTVLPYKILIVEDSLLNRNLIISMLKRLGYLQVETAENGQEALEKVAGQVYDLILMDCQMPILDGYVTAREIRRREKETGQLRTPIIALTAYALPEHRLAAKAADMDEHATKPIRLDTLANLLKHWLGSKRIMQPIEENKKTDFDSSIDFKIIEDLHSIMGEGTHSLLYQFIEYAPIQLTSLNTFAKYENFESLQHKAHQFKGESAQIGAIKLARLCHDLEKFAKSNQKEQITECLLIIKDEIEQVNYIVKHQIAHMLQLENTQ